MNNFVLANETFYSALIIAIFIFSDATPELYIKFAAGVVLISSTFLLLFANFLMVLIMLFKGREKLKEEIKESSTNTTTSPYTESAATLINHI